MFADVLNDLVMSVELLAPALPRHLVLPLLCLTGLGRSLVGVAGGATKAAVAQHQARRNNMADLAAKDGSQETLVNLVALCLNLVLLPLVSNDLWLTGGLFVILTVLHVYANYRVSISQNCEKSILLILSFCLGCVLPCILHPQYCALEDCCRLVEKREQGF